MSEFLVGLNGGETNIYNIIKSLVEYALVSVGYWHIFKK